MYVIYKHTYVYVIYKYTYLYVIYKHTYMYVIYKHKYVYVIYKHTYVYEDKQANRYASDTYNSRVQFVQFIIMQYWIFEDEETVQYID